MRISEISFALILDFVYQVSSVALIARQPMGTVGRMFEQFLLLTTGVAKKAVRGVSLVSERKRKMGYCFRAAETFSLTPKEKIG